jgi:hypothetical protein
LRLFFFILAVANVLFFAYWTVSAYSTTNAASRSEELQINPGRVKIVNTAARGPGGAPIKAACLEWGPFAAADAARAETALASLALAQPAVRSASSDASWDYYLVREPNERTVEKIAELRSAFPGTQIKATACPM